MGRQTEKTKFNNVAGDYATVIQNGLNAYLEKIVDLQAFFEASEQVTTTEFCLFTEKILAGYDSTMRLVWVRVTKTERTAFVQKQHDNGETNYRIRSWRADGLLPVSPVREEYYPILYTTIEGAKAGTYGTDLTSEPQRSNAIARARDNDTLAIAQDVVLLNPFVQNRSGFLAFLPVYRWGMRHDSVVERRRNILGVVVGVFRTSKVIDRVLDKATLPRNVDVYLFPANASADSAPVYMRQVPGSEVPKDPVSKASLMTLPYWASLPISAGDASWNLFVTPANGEFGSNMRAWLVSALILLVFGAVLAYLWASLRHALRLEGANTRILELAQTDILTSLANRRAFMKRLNMAFAASLRGAPAFAVLYLDVDDFKDVNDTLGHAMGDKLLKDVVARLKDIVREEDFVARFGGDELPFSPPISSIRPAATLAMRIGEALAKPFLIDGHKIAVTSSIGIAVFSREISGPEAMMVQADLALYGAKDEGRNCYRFHSRDLDRQVHERVRVADELRAAIETNELELYYQPQVELATGRVTGIEALVRWNHKTRGLLTPASFIPIAERTGMILALGNWIFDEACRQLRAWQAEGIAPPVLAINVSGVQLKSASDLESEIEECLDRWSINPGNIELELTESVLMEATQKHSVTLENLRRLGTKIAIDDFGTGYSSLKYLTTYPVNRLKLAQEFVFRVTVDYRNAAVVRAAIRLAHELGLDVIAEGVETEAQVRFLLGAGCEQAQGYYFSRPVRVDEITTILREGRVEPKTGTTRRFTSAA
ncbi:MAG: EAL domain-containing protein [Hyphomicrobiales bacterium]